MQDHTEAMDAELARKEYRRRVLTQLFGWASVACGVVAIHGLLHTCAMMVLALWAGRADEETGVICLFGAYFLIGPTMLLIAGVRLLRHRRGATPSATVAGVVAFTLNGALWFVVLAMAGVRALVPASYGLDMGRDLLTWFPATHFFIHCIYAPALCIAMMLLPRADESTATERQCLSLHK